MKINKISLIFLLASTLQLLTANDKIYVDSKNRLLRDPQNRHLIMHGVNVVYKIPPYIPDQETFDSQSSLNDRDIQDLSDWGFNLVRLGVMWESVESAPGVYNQTYLDEIDLLITKLGEKGIYTLVDAH
jgi:endoglycosylceramidase